MIKLISLLTVLFGSPVQEAADTCAELACLREYVRESRNSVEKFDTTDIFLVVATEKADERYYKSHGVNSEDGIYRKVLFSIASEDTNNITPSILYHVVRGGFDCTFFHCNVDKTNPNLRREVRMLPRVFLSKVRVVDLNRRFAKMKNSEALRHFLDEFKGRRVWIIDKVLMTKDTVVLIEVEPGYTR